MKPRKERMRAEGLGSRADWTLSSGAPPSLTTPSILAEQEKDKSSKMVIKMVTVTIPEGWCTFLSFILM
jgi:hypothetical protein